MPYYIPPGCGTVLLVLLSAYIQPVYTKPAGLVGARMNTRVHSEIVCVCVGGGCGCVCGGGEVHHPVVSVRG